jgi:FixJ family two-component response regulator
MSANVLAVTEADRMKSNVAASVLASVGGYGATESVRRGRLAGVTGTVFVVDDDISMRESVKRLIRAAGWQPETFASAEEFLSHPRTAIPCCLVLDLTLPGRSGLELQQELAGRRDIPIIFVTGCGDVPTTVQAMRAGAVEVLTKPFKEDVLLDAISAAIDRSSAAIRDHSTLQAMRNCYSSLTPREQQVMALVVSGLLNKQVGGELGISEATVKAHRGQVTRKMKADSLPDLVNMASRLGLKVPRKNADAAQFIVSDPVSCYRSTAMIHQCDVAVL